MKKTATRRRDIHLCRYRFAARSAAGPHERSPCGFSRISVIYWPVACTASIHLAGSARGSEAFPRRQAPRWLTLRRYQVTRARVRVGASKQEILTERNEDSRERPVDDAGVVIITMVLHR